MEIFQNNYYNWIKYGFHTWKDQVSPFIQIEEKYFFYLNLQYLVCASNNSLVDTYVSQRKFFKFMKDIKVMVAYEVFQTKKENRSTAILSNEARPGVFLSLFPFISFRMRQIKYSLVLIKNSFSIIIPNVTEKRLEKLIRKYLRIE